MMDKTNNKKSQEIKSVMTAKELLELEIKEIPMLAEGLIQKTGLVGITGSSDVGKSCFLRQLALSIVMEKPDFLGFKLNTETNNVIYVSTEDLMTDLAFLIRKQLGDPKKVDQCFDNLTFITDTSKLFNNLDKLMKVQQPDCVIIDCFTDIFIGDMNMTNSVREPLNKFKNLAQRYKSLFVVLNHVGKRTERNQPSKHNSLGSQGFEAKMRMLAEIRLDQQEDNKRHLCIVKGNYIPNSQKTKSHVLKMNQDTLWFTNTGERTQFSELGAQRSTLKEQWFEPCCQLKDEDPERSITQIFESLQKEGFDGSRATVGNWLREHKEIEQ